MRNALLPAVLTLCFTAMTAVGQSAPPPPYRDTSLAAEERAADLVGRMTLAEKAGQLRDEAPAIPRLGIPAYNWWSEGLHGVARAGYATVFPQAIGMAAMWDAPLTHDIADSIATEFRAKYVQKAGADGSSQKYRGLTVWSPNINIFRDPRWGRGQETYGEDPYLTARLGVAFIRGLQGDDPHSYKTVATAKHYAVHSGPEADRHREDVHPSPYDLEDTYLPAFRAAVTEAKVAAVMCAYNAVDGVPACGNTALLNRLRNNWHFSGHVVSDCAAIADFFLENSHHYVKTPPEAAAIAIRTGTDLFCGESGDNSSSDAQPIIDAVNHGLLPEALVDRAARRLFEARIRLGLFDPPATAPYARITAQDNDTPAHQALARKAAEESLVLLKNDGLLPLKTTPKRIAVIGPNADSVDALLGNYNGTPSHPMTVLAGLKARFPNAVIQYVEGSDLTGPALEKVPDATLCVDAACKTPGLNRTEDGATAGPAIISANAQFVWGKPTREARNSILRWTGFITPKESGPFRFGFAGDTRFRITISNAVIVDAWDNFDPQKTGTITLQAGHAYALTVEARQSSDRGDQHLMWERPGHNAQAALATARKADLTVFVGGLSSHLEGEEMTVHAPGFASGDRTSLNLPAAQEELLEQLGGLHKPVILVLMNGSAISTNWANQHIPAIVEAWYPGGEGGHAVASLLAGDFSPAGRLPVTFYKSADQLPPFKNYAMTGRTYRYFTGMPLYPFGYGLSYTRFSYGPVTLDHDSVVAGGSVHAFVQVTNSGSRDGDEVVQLYVSHPISGTPLRALQGFKRITLKAGETRRVDFVLDERAMSLVDAKGNRTVSPGTVTLWIGGGQPTTQTDLPQTAGAATRFTVTGQKNLSD